MSARKRDGGGAGGAEMMDEFACSGMLRDSLTLLHSTVERIFRVIFDVGEDDFSHANTGQIWLKLRGQDDCVQAAKLFLKGVVNQEQQQELCYPDVLHCVFCGARGLFMDSLIRRTSANIVVGSVGFLLISGLTEPVVQAYSLITDLVERCSDTQSRRADIGEKCPGESLESRRAFKVLVEKWEDRHILDLLLLPASVKEILSELVKESGFDSTPRFPMVSGNEGVRSNRASEWDRMTHQWVKGMAARSWGDSATGGLDCFQSFCTSSGSQGRVEGAEERLTHSPYVVEGEEQVATSATKGPVEPRAEEDLQFLLLRKFFTAMGYTEDVVKRVLAQTGPKEASQILDLVQQEQDRNDQELTTLAGQTAQIALSNGPCESEHQEGGDVAAEGGEATEVCGEEQGKAATGRCFVGDRKDQRQQSEPEEDFVFGVLKKAAASCGYPEQRVAKVYNMLPERSTHQLLLELQRDEVRETDNFGEGPSEMDDVVLESEEDSLDKTRGDTELLVPAVRREPLNKGWMAVPKLIRPAAEPAMLNWTGEPQPFATNQYSSHAKLFQTPKASHDQFPEVQGPPMPTYPPSLDPPQIGQQPQVRKDPIGHRPNQDVHHVVPHFSSSLKREPGSPPSHLQRGGDSSPNRVKEKVGVATPSSAMVVTGEQRFEEGLQKPFRLQLTDQPGDPNLRRIIIDGSNVAMSHGLGHFFSCRGIALAVQHFWDRGHRQITTFLPQWRKKKDPKTKEPHYLDELHQVGLVSFTPSREVQGKKICSYDDRFMLQLAQQSDGVIVTNDNLRDLSDESAVWRDIVKKRLLQYTFAGDLFMLPDDPLGRGGPHLHDFLRSDHRNPVPGHHSFAGIAATLSPVPPRSQTEVLNYRDRTLGGAQDASRRGSRARGRERENGWSQRGRLGGPAAAVDRSPEETAGLREQLCQVFTGQDSTVALVLQCNPTEKDVNVLSDLILEQQTD